MRTPLSPLTRDRASG